MTETAVYVTNKQLFLNLQKYYRSIDEDISQNIPLTFLIYNNCEDSSFDEFLKYAQYEDPASFNQGKGIFLFYRFGYKSNKD